MNFVHALTAGFGPEGLRTIWGEPRAELGYRRHYVPPSSWMLAKHFFHEVGEFRTVRNLVLPVDTDLVDRAAKQDSVFACTRRISVAKFPSHWFDRPYSRRFEDEQSNFWDEIRNDAISCEQRLLNHVLLQFASTTSGGFPKPRESLSSAVGLLKHSVWQSAVHSNRIDSLVKFRRQRAIKTTRRIRGLSPL